ncbi:ATP phosphoribosyltransferase [Rubripirellula lacrimiformis]|uniref:ATP phosphoribosyltransferase n=1 Tax=Rubripirellula lacrimiformis TaxID=1930273 RepID=A0A517NL81_9BACT|nr:ATP phosphoribosyltransferase [Rubripirellula lacrimiformis]QDT07897.1 ATP phosphoribosyltransferase [Rubripirellula lacrimiformis]
MGSDRNLRIGIPSKGRLSDIAGELLGQAGLNFRRQSRGLFARVSGLPIDIIFLRTDDIPTLCNEGAIDMGITGSDLVEESAVDVKTRMKLGVGRCRLAICVPDNAAYQSAADLDQKRIASSFPTITNTYLAAHGASAHLVSLSGSVEVMIQLGVADAIVDLVETGSTLAANRLRVLEDIGSYETVLIQNNRGHDPDTADRIVRRLEGVVIARDYSSLEYNVPRSKLAEVEQITPGYDSPTVNSLEDKNWCSVRAMVRRKDIIDTMERLEAAGASAIIETPILNCRL